MTFNWKIPAAAAGGAFLLSLLVGLFGRVGFGTAIARGLLWAVVFGALAFGIDYLLRRFLPELFTGTESVAEEGERAVDITLDEENPLAEEASSVSQSGPQSAPQGDRQDGDEEKAEEETVPTVEDAFGDDSEEITTTAERVAEDSGEESDKADGELPDLESVETAFVTTGAEEQDDEQQVVSIDALGIDEDPAIVARAVRTFMNKDQEG